MDEVLTELRRLGYVIIEPDDYCTRSRIQYESTIYTIGAIDEDMSSDSTLNELMKALLSMIPRLEQYKVLVQKITQFPDNPVFGNFMALRSANEVVRYMNLSDNDHSRLCNTFDELDEVL